MEDKFIQGKLEEFDRVAQTLGDSGYCGRCAYYQKNLRGVLAEVAEHERAWIKQMIQNIEKVDAHDDDDAVILEDHHVIKMARSSYDDLIAVLSPNKGSE